MLAHSQRPPSIRLVEYQVINCSGQADPGTTTRKLLARQAHGQRLRAKTSFGILTQCVLNTLLYSGAAEVYQKHRIMVGVLRALPKYVGNMGRAREVHDLRPGEHGPRFVVAFVVLLRARIQAGIVKARLEEDWRRTECFLEVVRQLVLLYHTSLAQRLHGILFWIVRVQEPGEDLSNLHADADTAGR